MKVLRPTLAAFTGSSELFLAEARIARSLPCAQLVPVYDVGTTSLGLPFFTMRFAEGGNLETHARYHGTTMTSGDVVSVVDAVSAGLDALHRCGLTHCDVKPSNILHFTGQRWPSWALGDLGLAHRVHQPIKAGTGSFGYSATELRNGGQPSPRSDIYSLAMTASYILNVVFGWESPQSTNVAIATALSSDPADRQCSAREFFTQFRSELFIGSQPEIAECTHNSLHFDRALSAST